MAGDWIKVVANLPRNPKVAAISRAMHWSRGDAAVGPLLLVWVWVGELSEDGVVLHATLEDIDAVAACAGFGQAMEGVGWVSRFCHANSVTGLTFPEWDKHNSEDAKKRAQENQRQRNHRERVKKADSVTQVSRSERDRSVTREEKRRESTLSSERVPRASESSKAGEPESELGRGAEVFSQVRDLWYEVWNGEFDEPYAFQGAKDGAAIKRIVRFSEGKLERVRQRVELLLRNPPDLWFERNATLATLASKWAELGLAGMQKGNGKHA